MFRKSVKAPTEVEVTLRSPTRVQEIRSIKYRGTHDWCAAGRRQHQNTSSESNFWSAALIIAVTNPVRTTSSLDHTHLAALMSVGCRLMPSMWSLWRRRLFSRRTTQVLFLFLSCALPLLFPPFLRPPSPSTELPTGLAIGDRCSVSFWAVHGNLWNLCLGSWDKWVSPTVWWCLLLSSLPHTTSVTSFPGLKIPYIEAEEEWKEADGGRRNGGRALFHTIQRIRKQKWIHSTVLA